MKTKKPFILAVTMGDPAGIGPEIIIKAAQQPAWERYGRLLVVGDKRVFLDVLSWDCFRRARIDLLDYPVKASYGKNKINLFHMETADPANISLGKINPESGKAAVLAVEQACRMALMGEVDGIVTSPLNKEAMHQAGYPYPGHTELLKHLTNARNVKMMLIGGKLRVVHNSTHLSLRDAIKKITKQNVLDTIHFAYEGCQALGIQHPRIAVAGLNPHAGENGLFGDEEKSEIYPAVCAAREDGLEITGPWPPDTVFLQAIGGKFDIVVVMYHDQGHIPLKILDFAGGVNITFGLPIIRTSVDHGTAFDIAGKGIADEKSLIMAIQLAFLLVKNKKGKNGN